MGEIRRAEDLYRESLKLKEGLGDLAGAAQSRSNLGNIYMARLDFADAAAEYSAAIAVYRNSGDKPSLGMAMARLALCNACLGDLTGAQSLIEEAGFELQMLLR